MSLWWISMPSAEFRSLYIVRAESINYYEPLIKAIIDYESRGDIYAFNFKEQACGPMQIRPCRINHYNKITGSNYKTWDCFDLTVSQEVFMKFAKGKTYEQAAKDWNGSGPMTVIYWDSIQVRL